MRQFICKLDRELCGFLGSGKRLIRRKVWVGKISMWSISSPELMPESVESHTNLVSPLGTVLIVMITVLVLIPILGLFIYFWRRK